jgi:hypothetical protein
MMQEKRENDEMRNSVVNEIVEEKRLDRKKVRRGTHNKVNVFD